MKKFSKINSYELIDGYKLTSTQKFTTFQADRILQNIFPDIKQSSPHLLLFSGMQYDFENEKQIVDTIYANEYVDKRYFQKEDKYEETIFWSGLLNLIQYFGSKYPTEYNDLLIISRYYRNNYLSVIQVEKLMSELTGDKGYSAVWGYDLIARPIYWKLNRLEVLPVSFPDLKDEEIMEIDNDYVRIDINIPFRFEFTWPGVFLILKDLIIAGLICQETNGSVDEPIFN